ncbi:hypothetical protein GY45DRAFT_1329856 [Cubamyces sp. BRFM 1775]|nr:hypothetical protein GY45DRAFT_1329856 [Cubamyces sp. BRFM 1775]
MAISRPLALCILVALGVVNVLVDYTFVQDFAKAFARRPPPPSHYTWIEDDVPERLSLVNPRPKVLMPLEESVRFGIHEPPSDAEWLWQSTPDDGGNVHLGPNHRFFVIALTHQQHCLRAFRVALDADEVPTGHSLHHAEHCLSFLREHTLCAADVTLEPGDAFTRNFTAERVTGEMECMDVEAFYATMGKQWHEWLGFKEQHPTV